MLVLHTVDSGYDKVYTYKVYHITSWVIGVIMVTETKLT